jgi:hypothetical protein
MAEGDGPSLAPSPASASTSLSADAATAKAGLEAMIGDRSSAYYTGADGVSAEGFQQHYQDLIRGELAGATDAVGVAFAPDYDQPLHVGAYDIASMPGAGALNAQGRDLIDRFLPVAFEAGLGQAKVALAVGYVLTGQGTPEEFTQIAHGKGWSPQAIGVCLKFYNSLISGKGASAPARNDAGRFAPAPTRSAIAQRKAEIEALMYVDGMPSRSYFSGPLQAEYRKLLQQELDGGSA